MKIKKHKRPTFECFNKQSCLFVFFYKTGKLMPVPLGKLKLYYFFFIIRESLN